MKQKLLETNDKIIAEASPNDSIWGIGLSKYDKDATNPKNWKGKNLLGFILMDIRDEFGGDNNKNNNKINQKNDENNSEFNFDDL